MTEKNGHCPSIQIDGQDVPYAICTLWKQFGLFKVATEIETKKKVYLV